MLPFCLRRTKAAVLQDLPPKVIADRLVPLSAVQQLLYSAFAGVGGGGNSVFAGVGKGGLQKGFGCLEALDFSRGILGTLTGV